MNQNPSPDFPLDPRNHSNPSQANAARSVPLRELHGEPTCEHEGKESERPAVEYGEATDRPANTDSIHPQKETPQQPISDAAQSERYRKLRKLGEGAYGVVWLVEDLALARQVALKEPLPNQLKSMDSVKTYLREAQILASLDHPHIVPVYDVGKTSAGSCYVVSKLIAGQDLATYVAQQKSSFEELSELLAKVAEALQHTHNRRLVHRDIKPANILVDTAGQPFVTDFGLALHDDDLERQRGLSGTPSYMSPEQARGEGHLVDGRSDIFSLGVVLYELLTGVKPFRALCWQEVIEQIINVDPKPPRQRNAAIPRELERICLKALAKRAADRYSCAFDLAADLRNWSQLPAGNQETSPVKVVPKGLRSFDATDSDFFLSLLPGPCDREGIPDSIRFWKTRIEETNLEPTFRVGLIYGPSGCGKSSLLKAGLIPRLADHVIPVFLEAMPDQTEQQLLENLRRSCSDIPRDASLVDTFAAIRKGHGFPTGRKLLLVIDQFEQWLHAHGDQEESELSRALRQCDGERIQALLLVRDDFWVPVTRFCNQLDIALVQGRNTALVDLFDPLHARHVLAEFGRAFGRLSEDSAQDTPEQEAFLEQAVQGLSEHGKVISVRLALFAEMMKGRSWTLESLQKVGGIRGVGTTFLDENFSSKTAPIPNRLHQGAIQAILRTLLPESGTEIKGNGRTAKELQAACGYQNRPQEFAELLRILDSDVRLITPTTSNVASEPSFQLTHDYLVPSLRDWLTRKQRATRRGRAELRLEELSAAWDLKPEHRHLPSWSEFLGIGLLTSRKNWTTPQHAMMSRAARLHGLRLALGMLVCVALLMMGLFHRRKIQQQQQATQLQGLIASLVESDPERLIENIQKLDSQFAHAEPFLREMSAIEPTDPDSERRQLHARLALVSRDEALVDEIGDAYLSRRVQYLLPLCQILRTQGGLLIPKMTRILQDPAENSELRLRAAMALVAFGKGPSDPLWDQPTIRFIAEQLASCVPEFQPIYRQGLQPIKEKILIALDEFFSNPPNKETVQMGAAYAVADFAADSDLWLVRFLSQATPDQFSVIYPPLVKARDDGLIEQLGQMVSQLPADDLSADDRIRLGRIRASLAVTLLRLGEPDRIWPLFQMTDDPEAMAQFVFRCRPRGISIDTVLALFDMVNQAAPDRPTSNGRYVMLLLLGEFTLTEIPEARRAALLKTLADWYAHDPNSGIHGASGWLLRHWGQHDCVTKIDQTPVAYSPGREWFTVAIEVNPSGDKNEDPESGPSQNPAVRQKFFYTFVVFSAGHYTIGSTRDEISYGDDEERHAVQLTHPFALLDREITIQELIAFSPRYRKYVNEERDGHVGVASDWYDAVAFCRWLGEQGGISEEQQPYSSPVLLGPEQYPRESNNLANWAPRTWPVDLRRGGFRLPTETEWEVACRSGSKTAYEFGGDAELLEKFGWFGRNSDKQVQPPRLLRPNRRGVFDLHGNVWEWTHDFLGKYPPSGLAVDPLGPADGTLRVFRGGCFLNLDTALGRTAGRQGYSPTYRGGYLGFRLALTPTESFLSTSLSPDDCVSE